MPRTPQPATSYVIKARLVGAPYPSTSCSSSPIPNPPAPLASPKYDDSASVYPSKRYILKRYTHSRSMYFSNVCALRKRKVHSGSVCPLSLHKHTFKKATHSWWWHTLSVPYGYFSTRTLGLQALSIYISLQSAQPFSLYPLLVCTPLELTKAAPCRKTPPCTSTFTKWCVMSEGVGTQPIPLSCRVREFSSSASPRIII